MLVEILVALLVLLSIFCQLAGVVVAFWLGCRGVPTLHAMFVGWVVLVVGFSVASVVLPMIAIDLGEDCWYALFPESIGVPPLVLLGWFPALVAAILGEIVKRCVTFLRSRAKPSGDTPQDTKPN
jgi:hypothetical protein